MSKRSSRFVAYIIAQMYETNPDLREAANHSFYCKCEKCREWWQRMGPNLAASKWGPFSESEIRYWA